MILMAMIFILMRCQRSSDLNRSPIAKHFPHCSSSHTFDGEHDDHTTDSVNTAVHTQPLIISYKTKQTTCTNWNSTLHCNHTSTPVHCNHTSTLFCLGVDPSLLIPALFPPQQGVSCPPRWPLQCTVLKSAKRVLYSTVCSFLGCTAIVFATMHAQWDAANHTRLDTAWQAALCHFSSTPSEHWGGKGSLENCFKLCLS